MEIKWGQIGGAAILGFLLGLAWCYWKAIKTVYENKDVITSGVDVVTSAQAFYGNLRKL
jgi:hypothetical protein